MIILFNDIKNIINNEINVINNKIKGTTFLEILRLKLIENFNSSFDKYNFDNDQKQDQEAKIENENKKIEIKLVNQKTTATIIDSKLLNNSTFICIKGVINIMVEDIKTKKSHKIKLIQNTGITLPQHTLCNLSLTKNSTMLQLLCEDLNVDIENIN